MITAESAAEARRLFAEHDVVGAFIDVWLGQETGFDLYAWLAEHRPLLKERIAFITGDVDSGLRDGTRLQALGRPVIAKPFELEDLETFVRQWAGTALRANPRVAEQSP